jgi:hypothetical protein
VKRPPRSSRCMAFPLCLGCVSRAMSWDQIEEHSRVRTWRSRCSVRRKLRPQCTHVRDFVPTLRRREFVAGGLFVVEGDCECIFVLCMFALEVLEVKIAPLGVEVKTETGLGEMQDSNSATRTKVIK